MAEEVSWVAEGRAEWVVQEAGPGEWALVFLAEEQVAKEVEPVCPGEVQAVTAAATASRGAGPVGRVEVELVSMRRG